MLTFLPKALDAENRARTGRGESPLTLVTGDAQRVASRLYSVLLRVQGRDDNNMEIEGQQEEVEHHLPEFVALGADLSLPTPEEKQALLERQETLRQESAEAAKVKDSLAMIPYSKWTDQQRAEYNAAKATINRTYMGVEQVQDALKGIPFYAKEASRWLRTRASGTDGGEYHTETVTAGVRLLPGWQVREGRYPVPVTPSTLDGAKEVWPGIIEDKPKGYYNFPLWEYPKVGNLPTEDEGEVGDDGSGRNRWERDLHKRVQQEKEWEQGWESRFISMDQAGYAPVRTILYTSTDGKPRPKFTPPVKDGRWVKLYKPAIVTRGTEYVAPNGDTMTVPLGLGSASALYQWMNQHGIKAAAEAVLPRARARAAGLDIGEGWARSLCQACFRNQAITPTGNMIVDHGYKLDHGRESSCHGSRHSPYSVSCTITASMAEGMEDEVIALDRDIVDLIRGYSAAGPLHFTRLEYTMEKRKHPYQRGEFTLHKIRVSEEENKKLDARKVSKSSYLRFKHQILPVPPGDPYWEGIRDSVLEWTKYKRRSLHREACFFRAAVTGWPPNAEADLYEVYATILRAARVLEYPDVDWRA